VPGDALPVPHGRAAGVALLVSCLLLLGFAAALLVEDRRAVTTLLIVFAIVSVPALLSAVLGLRAGALLVKSGTAERAADAFAGMLAVGHLGVVALSLRPGLDRTLDRGDLAGAAVGAAGLLSALAALAVLLDGRSLAVRLVAAVAVGVLALALLALRAVAQTS